LGALGGVHRAQRTPLARLCRSLIEPTGDRVTAETKDDQVAVMLTTLLDDPALHRRIDLDTADTDVVSSMVLSLLGGLLTPSPGSVTGSCDEACYEADLNLKGFRCGVDLAGGFTRSCDRLEPTPGRRHKRRFRVVGAGVVR
jgi:hypothetical protein